MSFHTNDERWISKGTRSEERFGSGHLGSTTQSCHDMRNDQKLQWADSIIPLVHAGR